MASSAAAVYVKNVVKAYGSNVILNELSMTVERGTIYGLLGSSGCGKTTLLSCVVGRKSQDAGDILVFGGRPGEKGCGVPGPKVGYMPQELALCEEFTIKDAMYYFGTIFKMDPKKLETQYLYLSELLELPKGNKFVRDCSGGQRRRVSFAAALIHSPQLLILDEPTVGVDPVLRAKIWDHLKDMVCNQNITVIITTHYIEETRNADKIGLMRSGKLLIEESPTKLLATFNKDSLEDVYYLLSQRQERRMSNRGNGGSIEDDLNSIATNSTSNSMESFVMGYGSRDELTVEHTNRKQKGDKRAYISALNIDIDRMKALLDKNLKQFYRNVGGMFIVFTFAIIQIFIFSNAIGNNPMALPLGIVNNESMVTLCKDFDWNQSAVNRDYHCHFENLACRFLTYLEHPMIEKVLYNSFDEATDAVRHGKLYGFLYIPSNFSEAYEERIHLGSGTETPPWILEYGEIKAYMDRSNRMTGDVLSSKLNSLFFEFQEKLYEDCHFSRKLGRIPIQETYYYGYKDQPMSAFMAPGISIILIFLLGCTMTSETIVKDKVDGVWDRSIVAGVSSLEITLAHLIIQCIAMIVVCTELIFMLNYIPEVNVEGIRPPLFLLIYIQSVCGMAFGFLVSTVCDSGASVFLVANGGYMLMTLISGIIWPLEAMPNFLKWISFGTPCTIPILSVRNVMAKHWTLSNPQVFNAFIVQFGWIVLFMITSVWFIVIKK